LLKMERFSVVAAMIVVVAISIVVKAEEVEEIAQCWTIERHIGIIVVNDGIREIVAAAMR